MDPRVVDDVSITDLFDQFIEASTMRNVLSIHHRILNYSDLNPCEFNVFFPKLKRAVMTNRVRKNWKAKALFSKIDKKAAHRCYSNTKAPTSLGNRSSDNYNNSNSSHNSQECLEDSTSSQSSRTYYNNNALQHYNCLVIGSGPAGLRTAIELQLLGASKVVVVEKRSRFSRNNVLHLWPFVIDDLKSLGAKKFYGKFCAGSIDHISIRQLQLILLKICLMIGCDFRDSCSYLYLCPESIKQTKQITNGNNSDSKKANSSSDNVNSITLKCDLDVVEQTISNNFVNVSSMLYSKTKVDKMKDLDDQHKDQANPELISGNFGSFEERKYEEMPTSNEYSQEIEAKKDDNVMKGTFNVHHSEHATKSPTDNESKRDKDLVKELDNQDKRGEHLHGARAHFKSDYLFQEKELHSYEWDIIIGADGHRNTLSKFFPRKEFRGRLAIAITANFINRQTPAEASVSEISGLSFIYNQDMFNALAYDTGIQLENICYYKDDTHYFVMTAKKKSLLERGVLINDYPVTQDLLSDHNVDKQALFKYAKDAAHWTTSLEPLEFALNHYGQEDCAMFDFTSMYAASNACKALRTKKGGLTLVSLVGDSLLEPFWPTGSGCARGFLSSFDASWMCRQWAVNKCAVIDYHHFNSSRSSRNRSSTTATTTPNEVNKDLEPATYDRMVLSVMAERESIYRILAQTTSENLQQNYTHWTLNPHTRYPNLNRHLVTPSQVEHLITDNEAKSSVVPNKNNKLTPPTDTRSNRRVKSPNNVANSRKSPKKLKSANSSPLSQPKNIKGRFRSVQPKHTYKSKSRYDLGLDETYLEFEESYKNLVDCEKGQHSAHYLNYRRIDHEALYDVSIPSISGTLPSSNNLFNLEARRARDIDECLRQRRQKTQLSIVKDHIVGQLRGESVPPVDRCDSSTSNAVIPGGAALFNELRRLREQQSKGKENKSKDTGGPLSLMNSIRRCASFAERVKSFESKLSSSSGQESVNVSTPKNHLDNVKNLPHFATLQELLIKNSSTTFNKDNNELSNKSKIPIMKLSKDDWNVKCWEKRLALYKQKNATGKDFVGSTKSLNKAISVDSYHINKPEKQVEVFKDRIKEMAEKLKTSRDYNQNLYGGKPDECSGEQKDQNTSYLKSRGRYQCGGWVSHLRRELIKGVEAKRPQNVLSKQAMNPTVSNKPIKKLFADDAEDDDGIDINKHYDHLCINRPTNKYLTKNNSYTSHLRRTKYNNATSKVINREPNVPSKQAYMTAAALTSRGSSASSTLSDYSTNTGGSSSSGGKQQTELQMRCFRCKMTLCSADKITIGESILHRTCLTCADCGITLRTNEIQHYLNLFKDQNSIEQECNFICAICKPNIRADLTKEAADRLSAQESIAKQVSHNNETDFLQRRLQTREDFLNERINYDELYKNIINDNLSISNDMTAKTKIELLEHPLSESRETTPTSVVTTNGNSKKSYSQDYGNANSKLDCSISLPEIEQIQQANISPSPTMITLPLKLFTGHQSGVNDLSTNEMKGFGYRIARSETIDGSEQVTLILPPNTNCPQNDSEPVTVSDSERSNYKSQVIMDEDELHRILNLNNSVPNNYGCSSSNRAHAHPNQKNDELSRSSRSSSDDSASDKNKDEEKSEDGDNSDENRDNNAQRVGVELSDDPSSLNSPPNTEDYDDTVDNIDQNSTYEDFLTSEEFGAVSDREDGASIGESDDGELHHGDKVGVSDD